MFLKGVVIEKLSSLKTHTIWFSWGKYVAERNLLMYVIRNYLKLQQLFFTFVLFQEQGFTVVYVELDKTEAGNFQSLVQISTMPIFVSGGVGIDQGKWIH